MNARPSSLPRRGPEGMWRAQKTNGWAPSSKIQGPNKAFMTKTPSTAHGKQHLYAKSTHNPETVSYTHLTLPTIYSV